MGYRIRVRDIMGRKRIHISPDASALEAAKLLVSKGVGSVVVIENKKIVGIVTEGDLMSRVLSKNKSPVKTKVNDIMTPNPHVISPDMELSKVTKMINAKGVRRFPVVEDGKFVGHLSVKDILRVQPSISEILLEKLKIRESHLKSVYNR